VHDGTLAGVAYTAGKNMFENDIAKVITKTEEALDHMSDQLSRYNMALTDAGPERLDEDKLTKELEALREQEVMGLDMIYYLKNMSSTYLYQNMYELSHQCEDMQREFSYQLADIEDEMQKRREKLTKLHRFDDAVNGLFTDSISELEAISSAAFMLGLIQFRFFQHSRLG
jgi:hypothetical protein